MENCPYHNEPASEDQYGLVCPKGCYTFHPGYDRPLNQDEARTGWRRVDKANSSSVPRMP